MIDRLVTAIRKRAVRPEGNLIWKFWSALGPSRYKRLAFSQEGEDLILTRLFGDRAKGFYVDVGAHHPYRFSNTYLFYRRGWVGINVDPLPGTQALFDRYRPRDVNLELAVLNGRSRSSYYQFDEPALNGFCKELSTERVKRGYHLVETSEVCGLPLRDILTQHLPTQDAEIDFLSVDVEGLDLEVLESNDWSRFRPKVVLVEMRGVPLANIAAEPIHEFMSSRDYFVCAKSVQTAFFASQECLSKGVPFQ